MATIQAPPVIFPEQDCKLLHDAMKGWGCDKGAIVNLLAQRTGAQTQQIISAYKHLYGKDLIQKLKSELSGDLERAVITHMRPAPMRDARIIHKGATPLAYQHDAEGHVIGGPTITAHIRSLVVVLCTLSSAELEYLKLEYSRMYGAEMKHVLKNALTGNIKEVIKKQLKCHRPPETTPVDVALVQADVEELYKAGEGRWGTKESVFAKILTTRSYTHVRAICDYYAARYSRDFEQVIIKEFSKPAEDVYLAIVRFARDPSSFFAHMLYESMHGLGTDEATLSHIIVSRAGVDMVEIKAAFLRRFNKSLERMVEKDTSGSYRKFLLMLLGAS